MKKPRDVIEPRWGVYALRKRAEKIGTVKAKDDKEALARALKECDLPAHERFRISVRREA